MVRVYRRDLGFGEGTDGQNYYESDADGKFGGLTLQQLIDAGYTTDEQEANVGRASEGGSIYTGVDTAADYAGQEEIVVETEGPQTPESGEETEVLDLDVGAIPKGAEFWINST